jgi:glutamine amidotransferase
MKVAIFDYGSGNLHSLAKAFENAGAEVAIEADPSQALSANALVLPGVGSFGAAAGRLATFAPSIRAALASGHPCLGICLGMQLLFEMSEEGEGAGVAAMRGRVRKLNARRTPHMGWNDVAVTGAGVGAGAGAHIDPLFRGMEPFLAYYANSFVAEPTDETVVVGWTEYERERFPAAVHRDRTWGVQFHPEKSGEAGLQVISNFLRAAGE